MAITWQLYVNVNSTKMELTAYHVLNKHKVTKTLSNFPWCKDTKFLAGESLCLQFSGVALRVFVSLCLIVLWLFVAPPAPEACRRTHVTLATKGTNPDLAEAVGSCLSCVMRLKLSRSEGRLGKDHSLIVHVLAIAYT